MMPEDIDSNGDRRTIKLYRMKVRDLPGWPPEWEPYDLGNVAIGEIGWLRGAGATAIKGQLHILMEHGKALYSGRLLLDEELLPRVLATLTPEIDKAIDEIADLEIAPRTGA